MIPASSTYDQMGHRVQKLNRKTSVNVTYVLDSSAGAAEAFQSVSLSDGGLSSPAGLLSARLCALVRRRGGLRAELADRGRYAADGRRRGRYGLRNGRFVRPPIRRRNGALLDQFGRVRRASPAGEPALPRLEQLGKRSALPQRSPRLPVSGARRAARPALFTLFRAGRQVHASARPVGKLLAEAAGHRRRADAHAPRLVDLGPLQDAGQSGSRGFVRPTNPRLRLQRQPAGD